MVLKCECMLHHRKQRWPPTIFFFCNITSNKFLHLNPLLSDIHILYLDNVANSFHQIINHMVSQLGINIVYWLQYRHNNKQIIILVSCSVQYFAMRWVLAKCNIGWLRQCVDSIPTIRGWFNSSCTDIPPAVIPRVLDLVLSKTIPIGLSPQTHAWRWSFVALPIWG